MPTVNSFPALYFPFRLVIFYLFGLLFWRLLFIYFNDVSEIVPVIGAAFRLDFSMICGAFLLGYIPFILFHIFGKVFWVKVTRIIHCVVWAFVSIVEFSSILLYKEWGSTLDNRAISYISHPQEAWASVRDFIPLEVIFFGLLILVAGMKRLWDLFESWTPTRSHYFQSVTWLVLVGPLAFLGLRGGWQKLPIVPSDAFYSGDMKNNFAATNKVWYFLYSIKKSGNITTSSKGDDIKKFQENYIKTACKTDSLGTPWKDKNIVLIIVEGWSADMVGYLYSKETITPFFDSLAQSSVQFTNAFSTGFRTDQGLMSILSGLPSIQSINMPDKLDKVLSFPSLAKAMKVSGRKTAFIYGGDLNFSNLYNYLTRIQFDSIIRDKDFDRQLRSTDWGVPDHLTVDKAIEIIDHQKDNFFSTLLLLSSHAPFEIPIPNKFTGIEGQANQYKSSVMYSDMALRQFFKQASKRAWYNNTIFIITSDHGSTHSGWAKMEDHNRFRIPMIIFDPSSSSISGQKITTPCNHFDLPLTICNMAGADGHAFKYSRDMFCGDMNQYAYWNVDVAAGMYGLQESIVSSIDKTNSNDSNQAALFLDMIKTWFNTL